MLLSWNMKVKAVVLTPELVAMYRFKLDQRGLSSSDVAAEMGLSNGGAVRSVLYCGPRRRNPSRRHAVSVEWMDRFDSAITRLTDARGGVYQASGTPVKGVLELARQLHFAAA